MENYKVDMGKNNKFKRNNILSFIFLMFMVSMIAMPNFTPKSFKHDVKNDKFLPVKFPWTIKVNRLSLINCVNYSPSTDATVNITISGNKNDTAKESLLVESTKELTFFINELKSFQNIKSKKGTISVDSISKNVFCYINYYSYNDEDNVVGISSFTKNDIIKGNSYIINNKNLYGNQIKKIDLYIHNLSNKEFNANILSYTKNGKLKKSYNIENLKKNDEKFIKIKNKSNMIYHIIPSDTSIEYNAYLKVTLENKILTIKPLISFSKSNLLPITSKTYIGNVSKDKANITLSLYNDSNKEIVKKIELEPYTFKSFNFKSDTRDENIQSLKLTSNSKNIISFTKRSDEIVPFVSDNKLNSTDILLGYNLSLGEKATLDIINDNNKRIEATIYVNENNMRKISILPHSKVSIKLNRLLNKKSLIGYLYVSSNEKISAKLNTKLEKRLEFTNNGQAILDETFDGIETPEYIIR